MSNPIHSLQSFENIHYTTSNQIEEMKEMLIQQVSRSRLVRRVAQYGFEVTVNSHAGPISILINLHHNPPKPHIALTYTAPSWSMAEIERITHLIRTILPNKFVSIFAEPILHSVTIECLVKTKSKQKEIVLGTHQDYYPEIDGQFRERYFVTKRLSASCKLENGATNGKSAIKTQVLISCPSIGVAVPIYNYFQVYNMIAFYDVSGIDWSLLSKTDAYNKGVLDVASKNPDTNKNLAATIKSSTDIETTITPHSKWLKLMLPIKKLNGLLTRI